MSEVLTKRMHYIAVKLYVIYMGLLHWAKYTGHYV